MDGEIQEEYFQGHLIRYIQSEGEQWIVAYDIAEATGYADAASITQSHVDEEDKGRRNMHKTPDADRPYSLLLVNENAIEERYSRTNNADFREFRKWAADNIFHLDSTMDEMLSDETDQIENDVLNDNEETPSQNESTKPNDWVNPDNKQTDVSTTLPEETTTQTEEELKILQNRIRRQAIRQEKALSDLEEIRELLQEQLTGESLARTEAREKFWTLAQKCAETKGSNWTPEGAARTRLAKISAAHDIDILGLAAGSEFDGLLDVVFAYDLYESAINSLKTAIQQG